MSEIRQNPITDPRKAPDSSGKGWVSFHPEAHSFQAGERDGLWGTEKKSLRLQIMITPALAFPLRDCGTMEKKAVTPAKAGVQVFKIVAVFIFLDARLRGHDELRHSLSRGRGKN